MVPARLKAPDLGWLPMVTVGMAVSVDVSMTDTVFDPLIATSGILPGLAAAGVNHIATSPVIDVDDVEGISRRGPFGALLIDHDGVIATAAC